MPTCEFTFDRDTAVYVCGEKLSGSVAVAFAKERLLEDIRIDFCGKATVSWVDTMARFPKLYSAEETYMEMETVVFQGGLLKPSTYNYRFNYLIPDICPTTCTTDIGRIYYELSLILSFQDKTHDKTETRKFTHEILVVQVFNIDKIPNALLPVIRNDEIFFCCWPCSAGPICMHLKAASGAYIPGNTINFSIEVANMSKRCEFRTHITASFMQVYKFTTQVPRRRTRYISYILSSVEHRIIVKKDDIASLDDKFVVPPLPPSTQGTHIISIKYELRLETRISYVTQTMSDLTLPILIGTSTDITPEHTNTLRKSRRL
ncbi:PREDICTED: arrestin domain-containing protein 5-like [Bactrocera latifrons]|uniref:Arrestin domain-containing protein 4 n=1 Tax=Bactrocera latifrons TaxID=174628 RepID=A0A0K8V008_BACLA|nr:PREDICTED: arrestin domain-containing protein 5-like [Bactrocera latifrons]